MPGKNILVLSSCNLKGPIILVNRIHINSWEEVCPQSKNSTSFWRWHLIRFAMAPSLPPSPQFRSLCCRSSCADTLMSSFEQGFDASFHHARRIYIGAHSLFYRVAEQIHFWSSTFYFILFFGFIYRSSSIRSGAVERIFLAHLVWFGFIFLCFCFGSGICGFAGVVRTRRREENWFCREKAEKWQQLRRLCVFRLSSLRWGDLALDQHVRVAPRLLILRLLLQQEWIAPLHPFSHPQVGSSCSCYFSSSSLLRFPWEFVYYDFSVGGLVGSGRWSGSWRLKEQIPNLIWDQMSTHFRSLWCCQRLEFFREPFWIGFL